MPGPDDTLKFLQDYAKKEGYELDLNTMKQGDLFQLKREAEALRNAKRGLDALMRLYLQPVPPETVVLSRFIRHQPVQ